MRNKFDRQLQILEEQLIQMCIRDRIVTYEMQKTPSKWVHVAKTILVVLITFFGAAFSMMAFNNDVDVDKLFGYIYYWMTGKQSSGFTILEAVSYTHLAMENSHVKCSRCTG